MWPTRIVIILNARTILSRKLCTTFTTGVQNPVVSTVESARCFAVPYYVQPNIYHAPFNEMKRYVHVPARIIRGRATMRETYTKHAELQSRCSVKGDLGKRARNVSL